MKMSEITEEQQYQIDYNAAFKALDSADAGDKPAAITEAVTEPLTEPVIETKPDTDKPVDELAELRIKLEKAEKSAKDSQAWGTKNAQRLAEIERSQRDAQREAAKPAILDANPELAEAIRYVASDPAPQRQAQDQQQAWLNTIDTAHPGIFAADADPELVDALVAKRDASGDAWSDPLVAIRDITAEKIAFAERSVGKRFAIESQKQAQKTAMSVPGAGGGAARTAPNPDLEAVQRIQKMSDADFAKEVRRVKGY